MGARDSQSAQPREGLVYELRATSIREHIRSMPRSELTCLSGFVYLGVHAGSRAQLVAGQCSKYGKPYHVSLR